MYKNFLLFLPAVLFLAGCAAPEVTRNNNRSSSDFTFNNSFSIDPQKAPPEEIQSVRLYRSGSSTNPPIIQLGSSENLVLEFDYLGDMAKQFRVEVTHRNKDWSESPLIPGFYLDGFNTTYFGGGLKSFSQRPSYFHFVFEFPTDEFSFKVSGNYLLAVYDYDSGDLLFSLPFFITENQGVLETQVDETFARRQDLRRQNQLLSQFTYPEFVEFPRFDLSFVYVQNQFWGRAKEVKLFDTSTQGQVHFQLAQDQSFVRDMGFNTLNLAGLNVDGRQILSIEEGPVPPRVVLQRDVQNLNPTPGLINGSRFGQSIDERSAAYAEVLFRLETASSIDSTQQIYLVGDFNNWTINERNRLSYNPKAKWWEGSAIIKEGQYAYKYVILRNNEIDDLTLDQSYTSTPQEYHTFVYYRDPARNYDRLLKVGRVVSN